MVGPRVQLNTSSTFFSFECEGNNFTVFPTVSGFTGPYTFELKFDGLAPDIIGTDADLQSSYTVQASAAGAYSFELIATDGTTTVEAFPVSFEVGATVEGTLELASLGAGFLKTTFQGPPPRSCAVAALRPAWTCRLTSP